MSNKLFSTLDRCFGDVQDKVMWFGKKNASLPTGVITTSEGLEFKVVTSYNYLGVWLVLLSAHIKAFRLKLNLDLVSSMVITPFSPLLPNYH